MSAAQGIVFRRHVDAATTKAAAALKASVEVAVADDWSLRWPRSLFVAPSVEVPWDMVGVGFALVSKWDVAAPFARDGRLACDRGNVEDQQRTVAVIHDLRVPTYAHELLLVRAVGAGPAFLSAWRAECDGGDERLAFLRALAKVKPLFLALPRSWLSSPAERQERDRASGHAVLMGKRAR